MRKISVFNHVTVDGFFAGTTWRDRLVQGNQKRFYAVYGAGGKIRQSYLERAYLLGKEFEK